MRDGGLAGATDRAGRRPTPIHRDSDSGGTSFDRVDRGLALLAGRHQGEALDKVDPSQRHVSRTWLFSPMLGMSVSGAWATTSSTSPSRSARNSPCSQPRPLVLERVRRCRSGFRCACSNRPSIRFQRRASTNVNRWPMVDGRQAQCVLDRHRPWLSSASSTSYSTSGTTPSSSKPVAASAVTRLLRHQVLRQALAEHVSHVVEQRQRRLGAASSDLLGPATLDHDR